LEAFGGENPELLQLRFQGHSQWDRGFVVALAQRARLRLLPTLAPSIPESGRLGANPRRHMKNGPTG
jgi:hypothetical protein